MTRQQIRAEKMAMQKELLKFETDRGRPTAKWERDIMRDIYDRYRYVGCVKVEQISSFLYGFLIGDVIFF